MVYKYKFITVVILNYFSLTTNLRRKGSEARDVFMNKLEGSVKIPGHLEFNFGGQRFLNNCTLLKQHSREKQYNKQTRINLA